VFNRDLFTESGPTLTSAQRSRSVRSARRAAIDAQESLFVTARRQYRRYRATIGPHFMAWPEWHAEYRTAYGSFRALDAPAPNRPELWNGSAAP
jgi:hypothetical protein